MKQQKSSGKLYIYEIKIPGEKIIVGPGTVPTSGASVSRTIISEMSSKLRKASKDGLFEKQDEYTYKPTFPNAK